MITFIDTYNSRKQEIENFIELIEFLESKKNSKINGISEFDNFFYPEECRINLTYQSLINILKSNVSLMIYNIVEYTVSNLIDSIYDEIKRECLAYVDVNDAIKKLWRKTQLKAMRDPGANLNTFLSKNEEIISRILDNSILELEARNTLPGGNLDGISICETFSSHGIEVEVNSRNYRPDILKSIKDNRNNLAHGSVSFVEAVRTDSISDIKRNSLIIVNFLEELIESVEQYISDEKYKIYH